MRKWFDVNITPILYGKFMFEKLLFTIMMFFLFILLTKITIATSIPPIASLVRSVTGEDAQVVSITNIYENPHTYEPKPSDIVQVERSEIFFTNGLGVDGWTFRIKGKRTFAIGDTLKKSHEIKNPHIWLDPELSKETFLLVAQALGEIHPELKDSFFARAKESASSVDSLINFYRRRIKKKIKVITYHPAWDALLSTLGIDVVEYVVPHPGREPSLKRVKEVVEKAKKEGVKLVIIEEGFPSHVPEQIAEEIGAKKVILNPVIAGDYKEGLRNLLEKITGALKDDSNN